MLFSDVNININNNNNANAANGGNGGGYNGPNLGGSSIPMQPDEQGFAEEVVFDAFKKCAHSTVLKLMKNFSKKPENNFTLIGAIKVGRRLLVHQNANSSASSDSTNSSDNDIQYVMGVGLQQAITLRDSPINYDSSWIRIDFPWLVDTGMRYQELKRENSPVATTNTNNEVITKEIYFSSEQRFPSFLFKKRILQFDGYDELGEPINPHYYYQGLTITPYDRIMKFKNSNTNMPVAFTVNVEEFVECLIAEVQK